MTIKSAFFLSDVRSIEEKEKLRHNVFDPVRILAMYLTYVIKKSLTESTLNSGGQSTRLQSLYCG